MYIILCVFNLSFIYYSPIKPELMDWSTLYPQYFPNNNEQMQEIQKRVEFADIGCGYGGLLGNLPLVH